MLSFKKYRGISESIPSVDPSLDKSAEIDKIVDSFVSTLIGDLVNPNMNQNRGLWDRFKGTMSNLWHGRNNTRNPYYWKNKLGDDLGTEVPNESFSVEVFRLEDYKRLKDTCVLLEQQINEAGTENLRIVQLIKKAAEKLKADLKQALGASAPSINEPKLADNTPDNLHLADDPANPSSQSSPMGNAALKQSPMGNTDPEQQAPSMDDDLNTEMQPPTQGKDWEHLTHTEIEKWNNYGGGLNGSRVTGCLNHIKGAPIVHLPWILRKGDPRIDILKSQQFKKNDPNSFRQKYYNKESGVAAGHSDNHCSKGHAYIWNQMKAQGRIEGEPEFSQSGPGITIQNHEDLIQRIEKIKLSHKDRDLNSDDRETPTQNPTPTMREPDISPSLRMPTNQPPASPSAAPMSTTAPNSDPETKSPFNAHPVPMKSNPTPSRSNDDTALSDPGHNTPEKSTKKLSPRQLQMIDDQKEELRDLITNLQTDGKISDEVFKAYYDEIEKINSKADIEKLKKEIESTPQDDPRHKVIDDTIFDWDLSNYVAFYKNKLHLPRVESKSTIDKKKLNSLSREDKVKYLKECLNNL